MELFSIRIQRTFQLVSTPFYTNYGGKVGIKISLYHICHRKIRGKGEKLPFIRSISRDNINYYRTRTSLG